MDSQATLAQARKMLKVGIASSRDVSDDITTMIRASASLNVARAAFAPEGVKEERHPVDVRRAIGLEAARVARWMTCATWANPADELPF